MVEGIHQYIFEARNIFSKIPFFSYSDMSECRLRRHFFSLVLLSRLVVYSFTGRYRT